MANIFPLNMSKQINKDIIEFKPSETSKINECEYKLIFNSIKKEGKKSVCEFTFNAILIDKITIKSGDKEYEIHKVPHYGIKVNFCSSDDKLIIKIKPKDYCSKIRVWDIKEKANYEFINITWDKIYIINLKRRPERKEIMSMQMEEQGIYNYEFIEAVDSQNEEINNEYEKLKKEKKTIMITAGHYGCLKSHIKAILKARKERLENVMILEDDAILEKDFIKKIKEINIPKYDMLYLGGITRNIKLFFESWGRAKEVMGTYGYILNKNLYHKVIVGMIKNNIYADTYYLKEIQDKHDINTFILNDIIKTTIETSDTSNKSTIGTKPLEYINDSEKYISIIKCK
jgi:GR25 family glycosyltransferase involved in LPS biosynthesis